MLKLNVRVVSFVVLFAAAQPSFAIKGKPTDCDLSSVNVPSGCTLVTAYCDVTYGPISGPTGGTATAVGGGKVNASSCNDNCGVPDKPQPSPVTQSQNVTVTFTDTHSFTVTGGISGGTFIGGIQAKLDVASGGTYGTAISISSTVSVTPPSCEWEIAQLFMKVNKGETLSMSATVQPHKDWTCGSNATVFQGTGLTQSATVTETADVAIAGSGYSKPISNGTCPPDAPF